MLPSTLINTIRSSKGDIASTGLILAPETPRYRDSSQIDSESLKNQKIFRGFPNTVTNSENLGPQLTFSRQTPSISERKLGPSCWLKVSNTGDSAKWVSSELQFSENSIQTKLDGEQSFGLQRTSPIPSPLRMTHKRRMASPNARTPTTTSNPFLQVIDGVIQVLKQTEKKHQQAANGQPRGSPTRLILKQQIISAKPKKKPTGKICSPNSERVIAHQERPLNMSGLRQNAYVSTRTVQDHQKHRWIATTEHLVTEPKSKFTTRNNSLGLGFRAGIPIKNVRNLSVDFLPQGEDFGNSMIQLLDRKGSTIPIGCPSPATKSSTILHGWDHLDNQQRQVPGNELVPGLIEENHRLKIELAAEQKQTLNLKMALSSLRQKLESRESSLSPGQTKSLLKTGVTKPTKLQRCQPEKLFHVSRPLETAKVCEPVTQRSFVKRPSKQNHRGFFGPQIISGQSTNNSSAVIFSSDFLRQHCADVSKPLATNTVASSFAQLITNKIRAFPPSTSSDRKQHLQPSPRPSTSRELQKHA